MIVNHKKYNKSEFNNKIILLNKKIYYEYFIFKEIEAGLILQSWEVKAIRDKKVNINNSYIIIKNGEAYVIGLSIHSFSSSFSYTNNNSTRTRKLLLHKIEIDSLLGKINHKGYTAVVLSLYWKKVWCKVNIGIVKGKQLRDKRINIKENEWKIKKSRIMKKNIL